MNENNNLVKINIELLIPNKYQPRKIFNEESLKELALSIKEYGILNPILVRKQGDKYEIIAGERRYRAAKMVGLTEVPIIIKEITDSKLAEIALIENLQRENISPIEEAKAYEEVLKLSSKTEQELSQMIGKSQSFISNKLRLLNLPENIQKAIAQKKISERHARSLMTVKDNEKQTELLNRIINEKLTVKELDNIINEKEINEMEIKSAIDDIMKSLNISDNKEKEEEKESDNMNNGNFFPNMNQNIPQGGQPATLNSMNMQTMGGMPEPQPMVMPTAEPAMPQPEPVANPIPNFGPPVMPQAEEPVAPSPVQDTPLFGGPAMETPTAAPVEMPAVEPTMPQPEPVTNPIPDFGPPVMPQAEEPVAPSPVQDTPLFGGPAMETPTAAPIEMPAVEPTMPQPELQPSTEPIYDIPVSTPQVEPQNTQQDKITAVQELLNSNSIEYKLYSNDAGHCIIIEL